MNNLFETISDEEKAKWKAKLKEIHDKYYGELMTDQSDLPAIEKKTRRRTRKQKSS